MLLLARTFQAISEDQPGAKWQALARRLWPYYEHWFKAFDAPGRPSWRESVRELKAHMPELMPLYEQLVELGGGGDRFARFLSLWCPPAYMAGCSQAAWMQGTPLLVRNYDYNPALCEAVVMKSSWGANTVIASSDCLWGALDGMNAQGLAVSLAFGGSTEVGMGFGIQLILRYILETCSTVSEGVAVLQRVPAHMHYTVLLVDNQEAFATVYVGPDKESVTTLRAVSTNHQEEVRWWRHALATQSVERAEYLDTRLPHCGSAEQVVQMFMQAPVYSMAYARGFGTLYTAAYRPREGSLSLIWPDNEWQQSFAQFKEGERTVHYNNVGGMRLRSFVS